MKDAANKSMCIKSKVKLEINMNLKQGWNSTLNTLSMLSATEYTFTITNGSAPIGAQWLATSAVTIPFLPQ